MRRQVTPLGAMARGLAAAAVGTLAMDLQMYVEYRMGGGKTGFLKWEFGSVNDWKDASAPGQVGKRMVEAWTGQEPGPQWAGLTNNVMHWGFGLQWGLPYGIVAGSLKRPSALLGMPFGTLVWLFGYAVLPLGGFYKPIWKYDAGTLAKDLASHLVYGAATSTTFRLLSRR